MSAAETTRRLPRSRRRREPPRRWAFPLALAVIVAGALALRLIGLHNGLPYVYNADENAHFVPLAIGMFGHSLNPGYFINPPGFTYVLHLVFGVRWGFDRVAVGHAFAVDPGTAFALARATSAVLGAFAVGALAVAGARCFDRRTGLLAAALLAVAFLPVSYGHLALNDEPGLAPLCLSLAGVAGVLRRGRTLDFALAGIGLGLGAATKYTEGLVLLPLVTAIVLSPAPRGRKLGGLVLAGVLSLGAFLLANPYSLLDFHAFRDGLRQQSEASSGGQGGKLGLAATGGLEYYLGTLTWGLGWVPALAALGGAAGLALRDRRAALVLVPAPVLFLLFMGTQTRFFARWGLPIYPILCLLAAWAAVGAARLLARRIGREGAWVAGAAVLLLGQGVVFSIHNVIVLTRPDTRATARAWMVAHIPEATKVVIEPIAPAQWAMDVSGPSRITGTGNRWAKWPTSRFNGQVVKLEDYERTLSPGLVERYRHAGYCWVVTGSTQYGRAFADPEQVPGAIAYYAALRRASDVAYSINPQKAGARPIPFSFDFSFNAYPLSYQQAGPQVTIYKLRHCRRR